MNSFSQAFTKRANLYDLNRWDYHKDAITNIFAITNLSINSTVADIGSGTGILTKHFLSKVKKIYAVDPSDGMRKVAEKKFSGFQAFHSIDGYSNKTRLKDRQIDLIVIGQAIHYFDFENTIKEFNRIIQRDGWLAVLSIIQINDKLSKACKDIFSEENGCDMSLPKLKPRKIHKRNYFKDGYQVFNFYHKVEEDFNHFLGGLCSSAEAPLQNNPLYPKFRSEVEYVFNLFSTDNKIVFELNTELYIGKLVL